MYRVNNCCFTVPLNVGVVLIAIFEIFVTIGNIILVVENEESDNAIRYGFYSSEFFALLVSVIVMIPAFATNMPNSTKRLLIIPWLTYNAIYCILITALVVAMIVLSAIVAKTSHAVLFLSFTLYLVIYLPFLIYSWIVVYSYYHSIGYTDISDNISDMNEVRTDNNVRRNIDRCKTEHDEPEIIAL